MAIAVTIIDIDVTTIAGVTLANDTQGRVSWTSLLGQRGTCAITLFVLSGSYMPQIGQIIGIFDQGVRVWSGTIDRIVRTSMDPVDGLYTLDITGTSPEEILDRRFCQIDTFGIDTLHTDGGWYTGEIVLALVNKYLYGQSEDINIGNIQQGTKVFFYVCNYQPLSQVMDDLASKSEDPVSGAGYYWFVSPDTFNINFIPRGTVPAPFSINNTSVDPEQNLTSTNTPPMWPPSTGQGGSGGGLGSELNVVDTRQDYRNRQYVRVAYSAFDPLIEKFTSTGTPGQTFNLTKGLGAMVSVVVQGGTAASVTGTFTGGMANGDTITIAGIVYTWVTALDNTIPYQILIQGSATAAAIALQEAVNAVQSAAGIDFSSPTPANGTATAGTPSAGVIVVSSTATGAQGNSIAVSASSGAFSWGAGTMSGGTDSGATAITQQASQLLSPLFLAKGSNSDFYYNYGFVGVTQASDKTGPNSGAIITVTYYPIGSDIITVQDDAEIAERSAAEFNTGIYEFLTTLTQITNGQIGLLEAQSLIATYADLANFVYCEIRKPGLQTGMTVSVHLPTPAVDGTYLINEVIGTYIPGENCFRYQLELISTSRIGTWLQLWQLLATTQGGTSFSPGGGGGGSTQQGVMTLKLDSDTVGVAPQQAYSSIVFPGSPIAGGTTCFTPPSSATMILDILFSCSPLVELNGAINNSVTTLTVSQDFPKPIAVTFTIKIDTEDMHVTAKTGVGNVTWTIVRGVNATTAASHADKSWIWVSIFPDGSANKLNYTTAQSGRVAMPAFASNINFDNTNYFMREDVIQAGGALGITSVLRWG